MFAAKGINDGGGDFDWVTVGNGTSGTLDSAGATSSGTVRGRHQEGKCSLNANPDEDGEDPRVAAGTLIPGDITAAWVV